MTRCARMGWLHQVMACCRVMQKSNPVGTRYRVHCFRAFCPLPEMFLIQEEFLVHSRALILCFTDLGEISCYRWAYFCSPEHLPYALTMRWGTDSVDGLIYPRLLFSLRFALRPVCMPVARMNIRIFWGLISYQLVQWNKMCQKLFMLPSNSSRCSYSAGQQVLLLLKIDF